MRRPPLLALCCLATTLLCLRPARAYILPAPALCQMLAEARARNGVRDISLTLNSDVVGRDHQVDERLYFKRAERLRLVRQDASPSVRIEREGQAAHLQGQALSVGPRPSDNLLPILFAPKGANVQEQGERICACLRAAGIALEVVALARHDRGFAYLIGARAFEPQLPQVWLDHTTLQPLRIVLPGGAAPWMAAAGDGEGAPASTPAAAAAAQAPEADGYPGGGEPTLNGAPGAPVVDPHRYELRLLGYGEGPAGHAFPKFFEEYLGGSLVRRAEVVQARFNSRLPETLFEWSLRSR